MLSGWVQTIEAEADGLTALTAIRILFFTFLISFLSLKKQIESERQRRQARQSGVECGLKVDGRCVPPEIH